MPKYRVTASGHTQAVKSKDDAGDTVTHFVRYNKGDEIDLPESEAQRLVDTGGLVLATEDDDAEATQVAFETTTSTPQNPAQSDATAGAAGVSGQTADEGLRGDADATGASVAPDGDDAFEGLDYAGLRAAASARGLDTSGKADDLRDRLRAFTEGESAEDLNP